MNDPANTCPGTFISSLALDATLPAYPLLYIPTVDHGDLTLHQFLKEAVEHSGFANVRSLWDKTVYYAEIVLNEKARNIWLDWLFNAFTGLHPPDVDLSGWLIALDYYSLPHAHWESTDMDAHQIALVKDFIDSYLAKMDRARFTAIADECRSHPLTAWDEKMHQAYNFAYFGLLDGFDPFVALKFANQGEALRQILRSYPFDTVPNFPHIALRTAAQALIDQRHIWMPEGRNLSRRGRDRDGVDVPPRPRVAGVCRF